jgi:HSP20 family protein
MANDLKPWSSLREMERFRREFDALFDRFLSGGHLSPAFANDWGNWPSLESFFKDDHLVVRADLPGVDPKDVDVSVSGNTLTIRGTRQSKREDRAGDYMHREVAYGSFERSMTLPEGVKADEMKAVYKDGVLELRIPAAPELAGRKIPIAIEGGDKLGKK